MEVESAPPADYWSFLTELEGAAGTGYYEWRHADSSGSIDSPNKGVLSYPMLINKTGVYRFLFRSSAPHPTEHNDVWVRFRDNRVEARTQAGDVIDLGQNKWFKVYQGKGQNEWNWAAHTEEGPHQVYAIIETPGEYTLQLSGRSTLFKMDRMSFFLFESVTWGTATNLNTPQSECMLPVELIAFDGVIDTGEAVLTWSTASELNNAGFDVEFSTSPDAGFTKVGYVAGEGTTDITQTYQFSHSVAGFAGQTAYYRLKQVDFDGAFEYSDVVALDLPAASDAALHPAYPNPFNPTTTLSFALPVEGEIKLTIYDSMGREIQTLIDGVLPAGNHTRQFNATGLANGIYMYRLETPTQTFSNTVLLLK